MGMVIKRFVVYHWWLALDQIRTIDKSRLMRKLGRIDGHTQTKVLSVLAEMFAP